jgi:membrane peptidoglycan carboxypeptidase
MGVGNISWPKLGREQTISIVRLPRPRGHISRKFLIGAGLAVASTLLFLELRTSRVQSKLLAALSSRLHYRLEPGPSSAPLRAPAGPYDQRFGYSRLGGIVPRLTNNFEISAQTTNSLAARQFRSLGGYPIYEEKSQGGLQILDRNGNSLFSAQYPSAVYTTFDAIPPLIVKSLLYVENRSVLDDGRYTNPAVEWNRLAKAMGDLTLNKVYPGHPISGGSTLATQLEKVRHSSAGRTSSASDKFWQMMTASLRAYRRGEDTTLTRREIVRDYINSFPLGAVPGYGEVAGLQEGLHVWFGADVEETNRLLQQPDDPKDGRALGRKAQAYRQTLTLLLALNRPSYYLREDKKALDKRVDGFLRLFAENGLISKELSDKALTTRTTVTRQFVPSAAERPLIDKGTLSLRSDLLTRLGVPDTYALDRLDLTVTSTFDEAVQRSVSAKLKEVSDPASARRENLSGENLLGPNADGSVIYSFTLYEKGAEANVVRVEADSYSKPLSINRGTRLELGSTAKLRTLITYLEIVTALHEQLISGRIDATASDPLTRWAVDYFATAPDRSLTAMLESALDREYSANAGESFFTGGGLHTFSNFDSRDADTWLTVREAFRRSVNLVFIRLMRDVVRHFEVRLPLSSPTLLEDVNDPARAAFLDRFVDEESQTFLGRFWKKYQKQSAQQAVQSLAASRGSNLRTLAVIFRTIFPKATPEELQAFLNSTSKVSVSPDWARELYNSYPPERFNWNDLGYLAGVHPLELWVLRFRNETPKATYSQAVLASKQARQETYAWLFQKKNLHAQNVRIQTILEQEAFRQVLASWKRQGYAFDDMVPSFASALGSSGDNPAALAELAGIILNDGVAKPSLRLQSLHFAGETPYETLLVAKNPASRRVFPAELAQVVKKAMFDVVEHGTARRAYGSIVDDGVIVPIGGKTGTGDNRVEIHHSNGVDSRPINRTATFVFLIGDRFFGTITAYVPGPAAGNYSFTSALPVQLFRQLAPSLSPLLSKQEKVSTSSGL